MLHGDGQRESLLLLWISLENAKREWNRMDPKTSGKIPNELHALGMSLWRDVGKESDI